MDRINALKEKVSALYDAKNPARAEWADWLYVNHVFLVADKARELAERFGSNAEIAEAAGMLHDIADSQMSRFDPKHEEESIAIGKRLLAETGFTESEVEIIVDAMQYHGCHDGAAPHSEEGKAMAAADALVHLQSDFYDHAINVSRDKDPIEEIRAWGLKKIERDFNSKILFPELKEGARDDFERWKKVFESLV